MPDISLFPLVAPSSQLVCQYFNLALGMENYFLGLYYSLLAYI